MFRDPSQLTVFQLADALALSLVQGLTGKPVSPTGCMLASAAIRPALRIQEACRRPGNAAFAEGLAKASESAQELHYLCTLAIRVGTVAAGTDDQALHLVKALMSLRKIQRERTVGKPDRDLPTEREPARQAQSS
jgi:hypothetical protein